MEHLPPVGSAELREEMRLFRAEMQEFRDVIELRLAEWGRKIIYANVAAVVATAGLVFAAARL